VRDDSGTIVDRASGGGR